MNVYMIGEKSEITDLLSENDFHDYTENGTSAQGISYAACDLDTNGVFVNDSVIIAFLPPNDRDSIISDKGMLTVSKEDTENFDLDPEVMYLARSTFDYFSELDLIYRVFDCIFVLKNIADHRNIKLVLIMHSDIRPQLEDSKPFGALLESCCMSDVAIEYYNTGNGAEDVANNIKESLNE